VFSTLPGLYVGQVALHGEAVGAAPDLLKSGIVFVRAASNFCCYGCVKLGGRACRMNLL
jgi:hypothetical protein